MFPQIVEHGRKRLNAAVAVMIAIAIAIAIAIVATFMGLYKVNDGNFVQGR